MTKKRTWHHLAAIQGVLIAIMFAAGGHMCATQNQEANMPTSPASESVCDDTQNNNSAEFKTNCVP